MLKVTLLSLLILCAFVATVLSADDAADPVRDLGKYPLRFAVIGDRTGGAQPGIYEQIVAEIERLKPEFVITVGDMIEGYSQDTLPTPERWQEYISIMEELSMPVYYTPGNNDIVTDDRADAYTKYTGFDPYHSFDFGSVHIVVLDNSRWGLVEQMPSEQIDWLVDDLEAHQDAAYCFAFFHRPFWYRTVADNKPDTLHTIFSSYGVDGVFSGHFHRYFTGEFDGIRYTNVGTSGGHSNATPGDPKYHFMWVTVSDKDISMAPVKLGAVLPWDQVAVGDLRYFERSKRLGISFVDEAIVSEPKLVVEQIPVTVELHNLHETLPLDDTVHWTIPEGWLVLPPRMAVTVAPGESENVTFEVSCAGPLYPLPELNVSFPYRAEGDCPATRTLRVAREASCVFAENPPELDGTIGEAVWQNPCSGLLAHEGGASVIDSTDFYFAYDAENIYVAVRCFDKNMDSLRASMTEHDNELFHEDCIGFLYRPEADKDIAYQLYVNPLGTTFDQQIIRGSDGYWSGNDSWNGNYETAASKSDDCWCVEIKIPLSQFGVEAQSGQRWDFNFRRKQHRVNKSGGWQIPHAYDPNGFGKLVLR